MAAAWLAVAPLPVVSRLLTTKPRLKLLLLLASPTLDKKLHSPGKSWRGTCALFGGDGGSSSKEKRKFITKEEEPEEYWQSAAEREGRGPMSTLLPYIVIFGFSTPFVILALGFANGWIKIPVR